MKRLLSIHNKRHDIKWFALILLPLLILNSSLSYAQSSISRYKQIAGNVLKDDELFVLFYMDLALVVDPTRDSQIVEHITTDNPWESLSSYLNGKSDIYFCPSGSQLNVAIEYMPSPLDKTSMMSDEYGMYRLSSPEELFNNRGESFSRQLKHKAVVFGGLQYEEHNTSSNDIELAFRGEKRGIIAGYDYLKSTYEEAVYIDSIFRKNSIETALLMGENGTEESFYKIPKNNVDILHIASHGVYNPTQDNLKSNSLQEWMMSHSWLALSGIDDDKTLGHDGKLTAYEISQTDLSKVNLVVLSACNTGLGDIKDNDVFGLLKGFKEAGAGTILVSLSNVSDTATSILMKRFYHNLFRGDNPRRALINAQRYIRLLGNGRFNHPKYWSTFILVDDIDRNVGQDVSDTCKQAFLNEIIDIESIYAWKRLFPDWEKIKNILGPHQAIIRICPYFSQDKSVDYVAMIGNPNLEKSCNVVRLFRVTDGALNGYQIYDKRWGYVTYDIPFEHMDSLIWRPILPYIKNTNHIYIQSAGILNNYPIENLPSVTNKYVVSRVSILNRLLEVSPTPNRGGQHSAALFGGLLYYAPQSSEDTTSFHPDLHRGTYLHFPYLPGTKIETDRIANILSDSGWNVYLLQKHQGTKEKFLYLSKNKDINVWHISTHAGRVQKERPGLTSIRDELLRENVIILSNCNLRNEDERDCFLQGDEIAKIDLSHVQLMALSTCNSAPDDVGNLSLYTESSWDMTTAFKLAGTQTILYSLWNIDDASSAALMENFYRNMATGLTLKESLKSAQLYLQSLPQWSHPRYWASFVLLDAIE